MKLFSDSQLFKEDNLLKLFENIHDYIYANDGLSSQQTLEEIIKILFIKLFDENSGSNKFGISGEDGIADLFGQTKEAYHDLFDPDDRIRLSYAALGFIVNKLQNISLLGSSQDAKGLAFQKFLSHGEKEGRGQFFTPEPVMKFCVEMIQPQPYETIIDPACGTGGFLIAALDYLKSNFVEADTEKIISKNLYGSDINKSIARIAKMKLLLEANVKTNILCANSLNDSDNLLSAHPEGFDIVLTNPPFGTGGKITNPQILMKFDLAYKWITAGDSYNKTNRIRKGQPAEILFVERCLQLLKESGRMGIVLPNGHLENPSLEYIRFYIKQKAKISAIVKLPQETFIPFGTGVKTSLLFLQKETLNTGSHYPVFFGKVRKLGYQGNKNGTPVYQKDKYGQVIKDKKGQAVSDEDFSLLVKAYKIFKQGKTVDAENFFSIDFKELNGRLDYDFYSPENRKLMADFKGNTVRLGDVCEIVKLKSSKLKNPGLAVEYVELSDINTHTFEIINTTTYRIHELPSRASYEIRAGDIITAIAGNSVGTKKHATAWVTEEFDGCICSNGFRVFRKFDIDVYFMLYFLKSDLFLRQMFMYRTGAAIPNVSDTGLGNILIPLPDDNVIRQISEKMRYAFELRQASKREFETIDRTYVVVSDRPL